MTRRTAAGCVVFCTLLVAACGVRGQSRPTEVAADDVPFSLVEQPQQTAPGDNAPQRVSLYFLGPDGLVAIERPIPETATPALALRELLAGPLPAERASGTTSALVSRSAARLESVRDRVAHVSLSSGFRDSAIGNQPAALAEIVYTLTSFAEVDQVSFSIDGEEVPVPKPDGTLTDRPVDRDDYVAVVSDASP